MDAAIGAITTFNEVRSVYLIGTAGAVRMVHAFTTISMVTTVAATALDTAMAGLTFSAITLVSMMAIAGGAHPTAIERVA